MKVVTIKKIVGNLTRATPSALNNRRFFSNTTLANKKIKNVTGTKISVDHFHNSFLKRSFMSETDNRIKKIDKSLETKSIQVVTSTGSVKNFSFFWLRDHCPCEKCLHSITLQRQIDTMEIPMNVEPLQVEKNEKEMKVIWNDNHESKYTIEFLFEKTKGLKANKRIEPKLWDSKLEIPTIEYEGVMSNESQVYKWLHYIEQYGVAIIKNVPLDLNQNKKLMERISYIRENIYGNMWDFTSDMAMNDTAYTNLPLTVHTDGCYLQDPPGLQMFHLIQHEGTGGGTIIVDGFQIASILKNNYPDAFKFFMETPIPFHYIDSKHYLFQYKTIFEQDIYGNLIRMSFNNDDRAPLDFNLEKTNKFYEYLHILLKLLRDPKNEYRFQMKPGNVVVYNNWRVLHGRTAFTGNRRMMGCYLNHEDFQSKRLSLSVSINQS